MPPKPVSAEQRAHDLDALHNAIILNDLPALERLFADKNSGSPIALLVNEIDPQGFAALHRAVRIRKPEQLPLLKALLTKVPGVDVDIIGEDKETPLFMAVHNNNIEAATALLQAGAKVNFLCGPSPQRAEAPLHAAVKFGYDQMAALLIHNKADINVRDGLRQTPLILAARNNRPALVYQLLANGANHALTDQDGKDALYHASENRHMHCVTLLKVDKKYLNDAMSSVRAEMKMEKPAVHNSDQLVGMLREKRAQEEEAQAALEKLKKPEVALGAAAPASLSSVGKKTPTTTASQQQPTSKAAAAAASSATSAAKTATSSGAAPAAASSKTTTATANADDTTRYQVEPLATRTHDPLTGKKLPPCKTLEEVGPDRPLAIPPGVIKEIPEQRLGGTQMVIGTGVPDLERPRVAPGLFINSFNNSES